MLVISHHRTSPTSSTKTNMLVIRHRRTPPCWRMLLAIILFSGLVRHCESMSLKTLTDSSSSSSPTLSRNSAESRSQNLGSPSELAWQAWLLLDSQTGAHSGFDSASFLRRITPKSVFIAPALPALPPCADGYRADTMGRCVKSVNIDHEAHLGFLLQRLNNRYGNRDGSPEAQTSTNNQKKSSGPFQLNIPLLSDTDTKSTHTDQDGSRVSFKIPAVAPFRETVSLKEEKLPLESASTIHDRKNGSKTDEVESAASVSGKRDSSSEAQSSNSKRKSSSDPSHSNSDSESTQVDHHEIRDTIKIPIVTSAGEVVSLKGEKLPLETVVAIYERKNSNKTGENESSESVSATSSDEKNQSIRLKIDAVVPVAEFVDNMNETSFSEVVDYKIPIDLKAFLNISSISMSNTSDDQVAWRNGSQLLNSTETSPMLLLSSSTVTSPNVVVPGVKDLQLNNSTSLHTIVRASSLTRNVTDKEAVGASVPEFESPSKELDVPPSVVEEIESVNTREGNSSKVRNTGNGEPQEIQSGAVLGEQLFENTKSFYDDEEETEDYAESTNLPDEESSEAEGGEILKHGEAGMIIPVKDIQRLQLGKQRQETDNLHEIQKDETSKVDTIDEISIPTNDSTNIKQEEQDDSASNVSSEVSINGDIVLETTLLGLTTDKLRNSAKIPGTTRTSNTEDTDEDLRELFKSEELEAAPSSSEFLLYDPDTRDLYTEEDPITEIHTIDEQSANSKESFFPKKSKGSNIFRTFEPETLNFRPTLDYNRHSTYPRQPVRFPSEEVNSIHRQSYKEGIPYPLDDGLHSSTRSSVFAHQKPFHRGTSPWRPFSRHQQQSSSQQVETTASNHRQKLPPLSVSFWTAMPLMRDPSLYSTDQGALGKTTNTQQRSYASNRYPLVSPS